MDGLNRHQILGNLGADPELKHTSNGAAYLRFNVATTTSWFNKESQSRDERTEWHRVVVWGKRAEALARILEKGHRVYIEGESRTTSYEKDGVKRWTVDLVAGQIILCERAPGHVPPGGERFDKPADRTTYGGDTSDDYGPPPKGGEDEIPF